MSLPDTSKLCIHTITTKPWPLEEAIDHYSRAGVKGITVWRQALEGRNPAPTARLILSVRSEFGYWIFDGFYQPTQHPS